MGHAAVATVARPAKTSGLTEPAWLRAVLIGAALLFVALVLLLPLALVFLEGLQAGIGAYVAAITDPEALAAARLTLLTTAVVVPVNVLFGIAAAWTIARFDFRGKNLLVTLIDVPFSVSPVIAGLLFVLLFGAHGWLGPWLQRNDWKIIFATPGIVLATLFVTAPLVARELIPVLRAQGADDEEAAATLGAGGLAIFLRVSLPKMKWGLMYGVILCAARSMGEFGAVSVVSGHIRGLTTTLPLQVEMLYNEYRFQAAFAVSSVLTLVAVVTLVVESWIEWRSGRKR